MDRRCIVLVTFVISLAAATGCASSRAGSHSAVPGGANVAELSASDPSWTPPGEMDVSFGDARGGAHKEESTTTHIKPNSTSKPKHAVHAAVY